MNERRTWSLDEFQGGIDLRDGLFSANQTRFRELTNLWIDKGRKLRRRPPCLRVDGELDSKTQGLVSIDGQLYTFAKKGDAITHTGDVAGLVQTLAFDLPDLCSSGWELITAGIFDGYAAAWILHDFPSATYPKLAFLHVWDGLIYAPTFVQDPYLPGSFSPSIADLTDQVYDSTFRPVLGLGVSKAWTSTIRGNAHCCRTADARVWNQRSKDSLLTDGEHWCWAIPEGLGTVRSVIVPRNAAWMEPDQRWAYYVLEYSDNGVWTPMTEVSGAPANPWEWSWASVASRFAGGWNEVQISVKWGQAAAGLLRLRLVAGATAVEVKQIPTLAAASSGAAAWKLQVGQSQWQHRGGDLQTTAAHETADMVDGRTYLLSVTADAGGFPELVDITSTFPNGWGREHRRFLKQVVVPTAVTGATAVEAAWSSTTTLIGTVQVTAGGNTITGSGTNFNPDLNPGDVVIVNGETKTIATRTSDVDATIVGTWAGSAGPGATIDKQVPHYARYSGGETEVSVSGLTLVEGNNLRINGRDYSVFAVVSATIYKVRYNGAAGNYVSFLDAIYAAYLTNAPVVTDYQYAYEADDESAWYTSLVVEYVDLAGAEDALSISTAAHDNTGGQITSITAVRQRMLITYPGSMQLWAIDQDTNRTAYLDQLSFGTGGQETPQPVPWYGSVITPVETGYRAISVVGSNTDNLQDLNVGEPIAALPELSARAAQFWPWYGQTIIAGTTDNGLEFRCLDYSRESKITAWSQWTVAGLTDVDAGTLIAEQGKLRFRSGTGLYYFDAQATTFRDFADVEGAAYESAAFFHFNDMGKPGQSKRVVALDIVQDGTCALAFRLPPYGASFAASPAGPDLAGPSIEGITYGRTRLPLAMVATAIAPRITTREEAGWRLQRLALDFILLRR